MLIFSWSGNVVLSSICISFFCVYFVSLFSLSDVFWLCNSAKANLQSLNFSSAFSNTVTGHESALGPTVNCPFDLGSSFAVICVTFTCSLLEDWLSFELMFEGLLSFKLCVLSSHCLWFDLVFVVLDLLALPLWYNSVICLLNIV